MSKVPDFLEPEIEFLKAIELNASQTLNAMLEARPYLLNKEIEYAHLQEYPNAKWLPLQYAVFCRSVDCVKELISYPDLEINGVDASEYTALFYAVETLYHKDYGLEIINLLLQHQDMDVNINVTSSVYPTGPQPVIFELMIPDFYELDAVAAIINHPSFDSTITDYLGGSILHSAITMADIELIKLIAPIMPDINCQCNSGYTVLEHLINLISSEGYIDYIDELYEITNYLLEEFDFDFTLTNNEGQSLTDCLDFLQEENLHNNEDDEDAIERCSALIKLVRNAILKKEKGENIDNNENPNQFFQPKTLGKRKNDTGDRTFNP